MHRRLVRADTRRLAPAGTGAHRRERRRPVPSRRLARARAREGRGGTRRTGCRSSRPTRRDRKLGTSCALSISAIRPGIVDEEARTVDGSIPPIAAEEFRGGSQAIAFAGGRLALVHEVGFSGADNKERLYHHRFVWFDETYALRGVSRPFIFERPGIEFAAGLAWHPDGKRLIISYGVGDGTAWLATVDADDVRAALLDAARLPSAAPAALDDTAEAAERFLGAESLTTPPADGVQSSLHAQETVSVESPPEAEHEVAVEPETPVSAKPGSSGRTGAHRARRAAERSAPDPGARLLWCGGFRISARAASGARPACPRRRLSAGLAGHSRQAEGTASPALPKLHRRTGLSEVCNFSLCADEQQYRSYRTNPARVGRARWPLLCRRRV